MEKRHFSEVDAVEVTQDAQGVVIRWLLTEKMGAATFVMRQLDIEPGGFTPQHAHVWEHEVYILSGTGIVLGNGQDNPFKAGDAILMPGGEEHQFRNTGDVPVSMLCLIPSRESECVKP